MEPNTTLREDYESKTTLMNVTDNADRVRSGDAGI
jgi:hypothetical protein